MKKSDIVYWTIILLLWIGATIYIAVNQLQSIGTVNGEVLIPSYIPLLAMFGEELTRVPDDKNGK